MQSKNDSCSLFKGISLGKDFLQKLGLLSSTSLKINSLGDAESRSNYRKALIEYFNDYKTKLSEDSLKRLSQNPLIVKSCDDYSDPESNCILPNDILEQFNQDRQILKKFFPKII